jgi:hypothetical protein
MVEMEWLDDCRRFVEILSALPPEVVQTASLPRIDRGTRSAFALLRVETPGCRGCSPG